MLVRLQLTIEDTLWPKLHIAGERIGSSGERVAFEQKESFDTAYLQFENLVHNHLRPLVDELVQRKKQQLA